MLFNKLEKKLKKKKTIMFKLIKGVSFENRFVSSFYLYFIIKINYKIKK